MRRTAIILLQCLLAALFLVALAAQVWLLPQYADAAALEYPVLAWVRTPCLVVAILVIACGQVVLAAISAEIALAVRGGGFRSRAVRLVDIIVAAILIGAALCLGLGLGLWLQLAAGFDSATDFALYLAAAFGVGLALLLVALRRTLKRAARRGAESYAT